jgi:hypothetical protein
MWLKAMRLSNVLATLTVLLTVLGAGLSYSGYKASLQTATVTSTQQLTTTSAITSATATVISTITTSATKVLLSETISLEAPGKEYCGWWDSRYLSIDAGQVHVSFNSIGGPVDFWMLTQVQWQKWNSTKGCDPLLKLPAVASRFGSVSYDFTTSISSSGTYYFAFMNRNSQSVYIDLKVNLSYQEVVLRESTYYSTESSPYVTNTIIASSHPAGLGLLFYSGIILIVAAGIILAVNRRKGATQPHVPPAISVVPPVQVATPVPTAPTAVYCIDCGASIPPHAAFCNKCGTKQ